MKTRWAIAIGLLPALALAARASATDAPTRASESPPPVTSASSESGATLAASADADAGVALRSFAGEPFGDDRTPPPTPDEWKTAKLVALDAADVEKSCEARRLREWMRIRCKADMGGIRLLGGDSEGVSLRLDPMMKIDDVVPGGGEVVFPVRRGDARVFEWLRMEFGYKGSMSLNSHLVLSESWLDGEERPTIVAR
jgi:hypothetical protein